jgi:ammonia channel protein AmtB
MSFSSYVFVFVILSIISALAGFLTKKKALSYIALSFALLAVLMIVWIGIAISRMP